MKPLVQKLPLNSDTSFVARTYRTPNFEVPWHQHIEYELILFTEGRGMCFIGNYVGEFAEGDVFFLGSNLPHTFQKQVKDQVASAVVVQFRDDFWGADFLNIPESMGLKELFALSMNGIKMEGSNKAKLASLIRELENVEGFSRLSTLCRCLELIIREDVKTILSTRQMSFLNKKYQQRLDQIFHYTITHFQEPITLVQIAAIANMSVTAFCSYFKKSSKKSYVEFLNEIRVGYACKLLQDTDQPIINICFESGFNTPVNFNKQFFKIKKTTPSQFRNQFNKGVAEANKSR